MSVVPRCSRTSIHPQKPCLADTAQRERRNHVKPGKQEAMQAASSVPRCAKVYQSGTACGALAQGIDA
ncbi:hypothetical protein RR42_s2820 [Cupriavidus basilensis]|uniref:Uncharacterized protein n=1 Tax=Cupriavidus basilensis TaxID=68895 RepID=A0A0C4YUY1_9BURK|nr:hypothetical protein RR42_s2820 [Cupriavidus basilensis]